MVKRPRRYSDDGYSSGDGDSRTAHRQVELQRRVVDDDFLDGNEDDNQQEIQQRRVDGILPPPCNTAQGLGELAEDRHKWVPTMAVVWHRNMMMGR